MLAFAHRSRRGGPFSRDTRYLKDGEEHRSFWNLAVLPKQPRSDYIMARFLLFSTLL